MDSVSGPDLHVDESSAVAKASKDVPDEVHAVSQSWVQAGPENLDESTASLVVVVDEVTDIPDSNDGGPLSDAPMRAVDHPPRAESRRSRSRIRMRPNPRQESVQMAERKDLDNSMLTSQHYKPTAVKTAPVANGNQIVNDSSEASWLFPDPLHTSVSRSTSPRSSIKAESDHQPRQRADESMNSIKLEPSLSAFESHETRDESQLKAPAVEHGSHTHTNSPQWWEPGYPGVQRRETPSRPEAAASGSAQQSHQPSLLSDIAGEVFSGSWNILKRAVLSLRTPVSIFLAASMIYFAIGLFSPAVWQQSVDLACRTPLAPYLASSTCASSSQTRESHNYAPYTGFPSLISLHSQFDDMLLTTGDSLALPLIMKRSEMSIRDVRLLVSASTLDSRQSLMLELNNLIDLSRRAVQDLSQFNTRVDGAAHSILITAQFMHRALEDLADANKLSSVGLFGITLHFFGLSSPSPMQKRVLIQYQYHTERAKEKIHKLLLEAELLQRLLMELEESLDKVGEIAAADGAITVEKKMEVLAELWTMLGGNKARIARVENDLDILLQVNTQRRTAMMIVGDAVLRLRAMDAELVCMRDRASGTDIAVERLLLDGMPVDFHVRTIEQGIRKLNESRFERQRKFKELQDSPWRRELERVEKEQEKALAGWWSRWWP